MTFDYSEGKEEAARIARAALPLANKYDLPANPINYAVFYELVAGQNSELAEAMEASLKQNEKPLSHCFRDLYHTFISKSDEQAVEAVREALSALVDTAGHSLSRMDGSSEAFTQHLNVAAEQLKTTDPSHKFGSVVESLIQETEQMRAASSELRNELNEAKKELEDLRNEFKRVRHESLVDPLTGIHNRRAFDASYIELFEEIEAQAPQLCLLLLDIDHFKGVNDTFGHIVGDAVLKWFAKIVKNTVKGSDVVARYGGEEFAILLPVTQLPGARIVAENIRQRVSDQKLKVGDHQIGRVTCSIGVAAARVGDDMDTLVANADAAMYKAKQAGRNKVCVHGLS